NLVSRNKRSRFASGQTGDGTDCLPCLTHIWTGTGKDRPSELIEGGKSRIRRNVIRESHGCCVGSVVGNVYRIDRLTSGSRTFRDRVFRNKDVGAWVLCVNHGKARNCLHRAAERLEENHAPIAEAGICIKRKSGAAVRGGKR